MMKAWPVLSHQVTTQPQRSFSRISLKSNTSESNFFTFAQLNLSTCSQLQILQRPGGCLQDWPRLQVASFLDMTSEVTTTSSTTPNQPYTILRIKRKRNEEPVDALVVETVRRKKSRGLGVFQYAETVEDVVWDNGERQQGIQEKISRLAKEKPVVITHPADPVLSPSRDEKVRRYTVVGHDEAEPRPRVAPPQILSSTDLIKGPKAAKDFKLFDAVPLEQAPVSQDSISDEVDKFLPLLNDYLKIHDINTGDNVVTPPVITSANPPSDDYVWDVFYHRPTTLSEWNSIAAKVGTLTGLPSEFEGDESLSDSDDEYPDEADEDSNAEEYYKNDYPDEEDNSDSDYDRMGHYHSSDEDFD